MPLWPRVAQTWPWFSVRDGSIHPYQSIKVMCWDGYMFTHYISWLQNVLCGYGPGLKPIIYNCNHNISCHCTPEPLRHYLDFQAKLGKCTTFLTLVEWCVGMDEGPLTFCLVDTLSLWGVCTRYDNSCCCENPKTHTTTYNPQLFSYDILIFRGIRESSPFSQEQSGMLRVIPLQTLRLMVAWCLVGGRGRPDNSTTVLIVQHSMQLYHIVTQPWTWFSGPAEKVHPQCSVWLVCWCFWRFTYRVSCLEEVLWGYEPNMTTILYNYKYNNISPHSYSTRNLVFRLSQECGVCSPISVYEMRYFGWMQIHTMYLMVEVCLVQIYDMSDNIHAVLQPSLHATAPWSHSAMHQDFSLAAVKGAPLP